MIGFLYDGKQLLGEAMDTELLGDGILTKRDFDLVRHIDRS